jgi:hypothetical protein
MNYEFDLWGWYVGMSQAPGERTTTVPPDNISTSNDPSRPRSNFTGLEWVQLPYTPTEPVPELPQQPRIVITAVDSDKPGMRYTDGFSDVTVPVGSTLRFTAQLRLGADVLPLDDDFRMPIRSRDGRERVVLANMVQGVITFTVLFDDSRVWDVTEAVINADLPAERRMGFDGIKVFAVEA